MDDPAFSHHEKEKERFSVQQFKKTHEGMRSPVV
jgi:hypothetical protein